MNAVVLVVTECV